MVWFGQTAMGLLAVWAALDGVGSLGVGVVFALAGASIGLWWVPTGRYPWRPLRLLSFSVYFCWTSLRGGTDVATRALRPSPPIDPCFVRHRVPGQA